MFFKKRVVKRDTPVTKLPAPPVIVKPSGDFDGNDGKWSTFVINVGDSDGSGNGQNFKVLISTSSPLTLVPQQSSECDEACAKSRGVGTFNSKQSLGFNSEASKSWHYEGQYNIPLPEYWYGTRPNATYGSDNVGLGGSSPQSTILAKQWVGEYTYKGFYMGSFGLAAGAVNTGNENKYPFLTNLAGSNSTPSISYGYTAGASYRNNSKGVLGNLVLGGFDQARFSQLQADSITMPSGVNNTLIVGIQGIVYHPDRDVDANDYSFTATDGSTFSATIDSTLPYLWLPESICDQFAYRFRLTYDDKSGMYTVNNTSHEYNKKQNATVSFKIGSGQNSPDSTTITLPYFAFDLQASSPLFPASTNYFPIKKSPNGIFILGRTFLQEAYIVVDYERANFTIAPAVFSDPMPSSNVVPIYKKGFVPLASTTPTPTSQPDGKKGGLAPGAIAGIVVGIVILFLLLGLGAFLLWKKRRATKKPKEPEIQEIDTAYAGDEVKHHDLSELDNGKPLGGFYGDGRDNKDVVPFPPINEMESPPAELYSPPLESTAISSVTPGSERNGPDYFSKPRRRGATRESSGGNTPGTPGVTAIHELPGDDGQFQVGGVHFDRVESPTPQSPAHSRGPSDTSLQTNIDEVIAGQRPEAGATTPRSPTGVERRPSHARGASDTTIHSDTTAVSQPTPEEIENWALGGDEQPRRPLSE